MKFGWILAILFAGAMPLPAEEQTVSVDDLMQGAQQWAQQNLDTNFLNSLPDVSDTQARQFLRDLQQQFQGDYVVNLAVLRETARTILPLLQNSDETRPYAAWLAARMDYLDVADQIRVTVPPPPAETNRPAPPPVNPSAQTEREIWVKKVAKRPWPPAAKEYVPELKPIFTAQNIPPELVWIAEVESVL